MPERHGLAAMATARKMWRGRCPLSAAYARNPSERQHVSAITNRRRSRIALVARMAESLSCIEGGEIALLNASPALRLPDASAIARREIKSARPSTRNRHENPAMSTLALQRLARGRPGRAWRKW